MTMQRLPTGARQPAALLARPLTHLTEAQKKSSAPNKWHVVRMVAELKSELELTDRSIALLSALLSFYPKAELERDSRAGDVSLIVFPSNKQLSLRAHGMAEKTMRRHLQRLLEVGLIARRDSPNGKRYAQRSLSDDQKMAQAYGFDLSPLLSRVGMFTQMLDEQRANKFKWKMLKEKISIQRREVGEALVAVKDSDLHNRFAELLQPIRSVKSLAEMKVLSDGLSALLIQIQPQQLTANEDQTDRHLCDSKTEIIFESDSAEKMRKNQNQPQQRFVDLKLVLETCPDIKNYFPDIRNWIDFVKAAATVRNMLGIADAPWHEAVAVMSPERASVALAIILQRCEYSSEATRSLNSSIVRIRGKPAIRSAGAYLRKLTQEAKVGELDLARVLACYGQFTSCEFRVSS